MISKLVSKSVLKSYLPYNISWVSLLVGLVAIGAGGVAGLLVLNVSNLYLFVIVGALLIGTVLVLRPHWSLTALAHPEWSLLILVFITYTRFSDIMIKYHHTPSITQPYLALLVFIIVARKLLFGKNPEGWKPITIFIVVHALLGLASLLYATDTDRVELALVDFAKDGIVAITIVILVERAINLRHVVWTLVLVGIFIGSLSVFQQLTGTFENNYWGFAQAPYMAITGGTRDYRLAGPLGHPNAFSRFMLALVPIALDRLWSEQKRHLRVLAGWSTAVCILSVLFTFSRGAFLGMVLILAATFIRRPPSPIALLVTIIMGAFLIRYVPADYTDRMSTLLFFLPGSETQIEEEGSFRGRLSVQLAGWMMFTEHPFFGVGLDNFSSNYPEYSRRIGLDRSVILSAAPHNLYIQIASEQGLVGLAWFGLLTWFVFRSLSRAQKDFAAAGMEDYAGMVVALGLGIASLYITGVFAHMTRARHWWLLWAIAMSTPYVAKRELAASYLKNDLKRWVIR